VAITVGRELVLLPLEAFMAGRRGSFTAGERRAFFLGGGGILCFNFAVLRL